MRNLVIALHDKKELFRKIFYGILAAVVIFDIIVTRPEEAHAFFDHIPGWWSGWGVVICLAMIIFWKWLAHSFLERDENYYDN